MKHLKKFENKDELNVKDKEYHEIIGYPESMLDSLSSMYQLWCDAENLPQVSADEQDSDKMTYEQEEFNDTFIKIWDLAADFERKYHDNEWKEKWLLGKETRKFNL